MTADEAKTLAAAYLTQQNGKPCAVFDWSAMETPTHWRFYWNTVAAIEGHEDALKGVDPVAVEKRTGTVMLDRKRAHHEPDNVVFPAPPKGRVASESDAAALVQAWVDATMEKPCFVELDRELSIGWAFVWNAKAARTDPLQGYVGQERMIVVRATGELFSGGAIIERLTPLEQASLGIVIDE